VSSAFLDFAVFSLNFADSSLDSDTPVTSNVQTLLLPPVPHLNHKLLRSQTRLSPLRLSLPNLLELHLLLLNLEPRAKIEPRASSSRRPRLVQLTMAEKVAFRSDVSPFSSFYYRHFPFPFLRYTTTSSLYLFLPVPYPCLASLSPLPRSHSLRIYKYLTTYLLFHPVILPPALLRLPCETVERRVLRRREPRLKFRAGSNRSECSDLELACLFDHAQFDRILEILLFPSSSSLLLLFVSTAVRASAKLIRE